MCSEVRLIRPIATKSLFSSGTLIALAALVKEESGGHRASSVDVSAQAGAVLNRDPFNAGG
jgi:hypothetical protein